jgi:hypothetical protein
MPERELSYVDFKAERAQKEAEWTQRDEVKAAIDYGASALSGANSRCIADIRRLLDDVLLPALVSRDDLRRLHCRLGDDENWHYGAVRSALRGEYSSERTVIAAFQSCVAVAEAQGIVGEVRNYATAFGYERRLGRLWSPYEMDVGDEVQLVTRVSGHPKTLFCGSTGQGKSATLDTEVADRHAAGYKIVDLVDTDEFENAVYDIPQRQPALREARAELDLPPGADAADYDTPDLEVLVPTTRDTADMDVPATDGDAVVRPFSIPASTLDETTVVSFLTAMVSKQQEASVRTAFNEVADADDWTLAELASCIAEREDLRDSFQQRVLRLLEGLQRKGFIRDRQCDHAIDWERIFEDQQTVTAFSVAPLDSEVDQLMVLSYLVRALYDRRRDYTGLPPGCGVMRELHEIVPHRNETAADHRAEALQEALASNLSYILRKNRHERLEILADTQDVMDLKKGVRKRFSRFVAFKMPDASLQKTFEYAGESDWQSCRDAIPFDRGVGAVIGATEPNVTRDLSFLAPVEFAPAPFHHFDVDEHDSGLDARVDYLDEELQPADWSGGVPDRLTFSDSEEIEQPMGIFADECLREAPDASVAAQAVLDAWNNFAAERAYDEVENLVWLTRRLNDETQLEAKVQNGRYHGFTLTQQGEQYTTQPDTRNDAQATSD